MKVKLTLILSAFLLVFTLFIPTFVFAATYALSGHVRNSSGVSLDGAVINVKNPSNNEIIATITTNSEGHYNVNVEEGIYNIQVTPPAESGLSSAIVLNQTLTSDKTINFNLTPTGSAKLDGYVYDPTGVGLPNQRVQLQSGSILIQGTTDNTGYFSIQGNTGTYTLTFTYPDTGNLPPTKAPGRYTLNVPNFALNQSVTLNITPPTKKLDIHVEDGNGTPIPNTQIQASTVNVSNLSIGSGLTASGNNDYGIGGFPKPQTDQNGNVSLYLFPNGVSNPYTLTATPPSASHLGVKVESNVTFTNDSQKTILLPPTYILSGYMYDSHGDPLANQYVVLRAGSINNRVTTGIDGSYSLEAAQGTYTLEMTYADGGNLPPTAAPGRFTLSKSNYVHNQNTSLDLTIPAKQVVLHVQDASGTPVNDVQVQIPTVNVSNQTISSGLTASGNNDYGVGGFTKPKTDQDGNVTLWLLPNTSSVPYSFTLTPPSGSNLATTTISNIVISADTQRTAIMNQPVTLSGYIYDKTGTGLANQRVFIESGSTLIQTTTNTDGFYSLNANAGSYNLQVGHPSTGNMPPVRAPGRYTISIPNYQLTQSKTQNLTVPAEEVTFHVQDPVGESVVGVQLQIPTVAVGGINVDANINANVTNDYGIGGFTKPQTDSNGNVKLWLFPNTGYSAYSVTATPSLGSIYTPFVLNNIFVTGTQSEVIFLQYNHSAPVTNLSLTTNRGDDTYSDPTTVTLTASAAAGYNIAHTYYKVDDGPQQTYTNPFTVTGNGNHTIDYWSVDNSGAQEQVQTQTFTIVTTHNISGIVYVDSDKNGYQDPGENGYEGAVVSLDTNQTTTTDSNGNYSFTNLPAATYVTTLTLPNGYTATTQNPATVALNADTTQNFGIASGPILVTAVNTGGSTDGDFITDTNYNGGSIYTTNTNADTAGVTNPAPQSVYKSVRYGNFTYTFSNLTPNATYSFRLHFNELYWDSVGARVFDVKYNGQTKLDNYDIYESVGGKDKAIVETVVGTANNNGEISLQFVTEFDNAMVNGIELYSGTLDIPSPTPTPTISVPYGVNTGGSTVGSYVADTGFNGGSLYTTTNSVDTTGVANPAPEAVYKSVRYGNFTYTLPHLTPNETYTLKLHFNELYWSSIGSRVFNVSVNGTQVLTNYDIFQQASGHNKAIIEEVPVTANGGGNVVVQFTTVVDNAMVNGLEIVASQ